MSAYKSNVIDCVCVQTLLLSPNSGTRQLQENPPLAGPKLSAGKPTQSTITMMKHNELVVGEDHLLSQSCQRYNKQMGR